VAPAVEAAVEAAVAEMQQVSRGSPIGHGVQLPPHTGRSFLPAPTMKSAQRKKNLEASNHHTGQDTEEIYDSNLPFLPSCRIEAPSALGPAYHTDFQKKEITSLPLQTR
jgi:hypothetical protein